MGRQGMHAIKARLYIAVQEKRGDMDSEEDRPGGAARRTELRGKALWADNMLKTRAEVLRSYEERRFGLALWQEVW